MKKFDVVGYEELNSQNGTFYKIYAISREENERGKGAKTVAEFVDARHLKKYNIDPSTLVGRSVEFYNVKDGDRWKSGLTFKNS